MVTLTIPYVDVFVFRRDGVQLLYLMLRGAPDSRYANLWRVLTGDIRPDETALTSALRALFDHTGLHPIAGWAPDFTHSYYDPLDDQLKCCPVLAFEVEPGQLTLSTQYDASRWITYEQSLDLLRLSGHRDGLRHIHEDIALKHDRGAPFRVRMA